MRAAREKGRGYLPLLICRRRTQPKELEMRAIVAPVDQQEREP
jgi:hypothetical protein